MVEVQVLNSRVVRIGLAQDVTTRGAPAAFAGTQMTPVCGIFRYNRIGLTPIWTRRAAEVLKSFHLLLNFGLQNL